MSNDAEAEDVLFARERLTELMEVLIEWFATNPDADPWRTLDDLFYVASDLDQRFKAAMRPLVEHDLDALWLDAMRRVGCMIERANTSSALGRITGHLVTPDEPRSSPWGGRLGDLVEHCPLTLDELVGSLYLLPPAPILRERLAGPHAGKPAS